MPSDNSIAEVKDWIDGGSKDYHEKYSYRDEKYYKPNINSGTRTQKKN